MNEGTYRQVIAANPLCPTCRAPISRSVPAINITLRDLVQRLLGSTVATVATVATVPTVATVATVPTVATVATVAMGGAASASASFEPFRGVRLQVGAETHVCADDSRILHLQVKAPADGEEEGADYLLAIDESGSMGSIAWVQVDKGRVGVERIELVKHMVATMAAMMTPRDRVAIVGFSDRVQLRLPLTQMTDSGKALLKSRLEILRADGCTNIYGAVEQLASIASSKDCAGRRIVGMLLTDGIPTESIPPVTGGRRTMPMIQERIKVTNPWTMHAVGFSSDVNSSLLEQLAAWGNGRMLFVPSGDMVSTNGINLAAYEKTVASKGITVYYTVNGTRHSMHTGPVAFGTSRDFMIPLPVGAVVSGIDAPEAAGFIIPPEGDRHLCRQAFVELLTQIIGEGERAMAVYRDIYTILPELQARLDAFHARYAKSADPCTQAMLRDVTSKVDGEQQVRLALGFLGQNNWGMPYLRAYRDHMRDQVCMNFKDPGLKTFETPRFLACQALGDAAFATIPPPFLHKQGYVAATVDYSSAFNNSGGSCFEGSMPVVMADGSTKAIRDIRKGDVVKGGSKVRYSVEFNAYAPSQPMAQLTPKVAVTPWHPCRRVGEAGAWSFPANHVQYAARPLKTVYNLVLESGHIVEADGYTFVTLGHGFQEVPLVHAFFGTDECIKALEGQPGAAEGRPVYENCVAIKKDGMIVGWEDQKAECAIA
uniref:VWFA domain-containing protein n=1 Tax=viral metagenome TaxID=1070528 RepID=A0A6C0K2B0_9ZZZZ